MSKPAFGADCGLKQLCIRAILDGAVFGSSRGSGHTAFMLKYKRIPPAVSKSDMLALRCRGSTTSTEHRSAKSFVKAASAAVKGRVKNNNSTKFGRSKSCEDLTTSSSCQASMLSSSPRVKPSKSYSELRKPSGAKSRKDTNWTLRAGPRLNIRRVVRDGASLDEIELEVSQTLQSLSDDRDRVEDMSREVQDAASKLSELSLQVHSIR